MVLINFPIAIYLRKCWETRKNEILFNFVETPILRYFETYYKVEYQEYENNDPKDINILWKKLNQIYDRSLGKSRYRISALYMSAIYASVAGILAHLFYYYYDRLGLVQADIYSAIYQIGVAGFAGGYMYSLFLLISNLQKRQINPSDMLWIGFRMLFSAPISIALLVSFNGIRANTVLLGISFMLGAIPTEHLITGMRRRLRKIIKSDDAVKEQLGELRKLQGVTKAHAERFINEGMGSLVQLAYADPVDLSIRTGFSFSYVVDCCSQALAWITFGDSMHKLIPYNIRGAMEICNFTNELERNTNQEEEVMDEEQRYSQKTLTILARILDLDETALRRTFYTICYDPYVQFLNDVWQPDWN
ncbi:MAG: hypothetical protein AB1921_18305 [Thermodesulfobacteriota bacterium]